mgnify:CR=1 FL=1
MRNDNRQRRREEPPEPRREDILKLHEKGKLRMVSRTRLESLQDLRTIYTPGVAEISKMIEADRERRFDYTAVGNTVAVVTNGTAVLGLGDIGVDGALPVMEGKSVILIEMADVSAMPLLVDSHESSEIIETVQRVAATFGGVLLEDIAAPQCFEVEDALKETLDIPVFHDDQHGTAVVVMAALMSALEISGKDASGLRVVISGAGAAGCAVARFLLNYGVADVVLVDRAGAVYRGREEHMNPAKEQIARETNDENESGSLEEVMGGKDVFIGLSVAGLVSEDMVRSMAPDPIVFAMANPVPEIWPEKAIEAGAVAAEDGRNINNALGFPGLFRGALDAGATEINEDMKVAAARALADAAPDGELVPDFMDREVHRQVAQAVADAARSSGVARKK